MKEQAEKKEERKEQAEKKDYVLEQYKKNLVTLNNRFSTR